jgi:succinate dehydrogenase/fumarate reductase flavoprotein subunit
LQTAAVSAESVHNTTLVEWFELRSGLYAAEALALSALNRPESRGAHQRSDFPQTRARYEINQRVWLESGKLISSFAAEAPQTTQAARA